MPLVTTIIYSQKYIWLKNPLLGNSKSAIKLRLVFRLEFSIKIICMSLQQYQRALSF